MRRADSDEQWDDKYIGVYSNEAGQYDAKRFASPGGSLSSQLECGCVADAVKAGPGMRILDVASGTGRAAIALAQRGATVFGLDLTMPMIMAGRAKAREQSMGNLVFCRGNARHLPFPDMSFDAVTCTRFFHLLPVEEYPYFTREMKRVLRPGGVAAVSVFSPLYGAGVGLMQETVRRWIRHRPSEHFLWPNQVKRAFEGLIVKRVDGFWLPGLWLAQRLDPRLPRVLSKKVRNSILAKLANPLVIIALRPLSERNPL